MAASTLARVFPGFGVMVVLAAGAAPAAAQFTSAIFVMDADGNNAVKVSHKEDLWLGSAAWSHDGKRMAYVGMPRRQAGQERLHLLEIEERGTGDSTADSQNSPQLLPGQFTPRNSDPVWSPDGKKIAFSSDRGSP